MDPTSIFLAHPWLSAILWAVLHSLDYYLTIWGARLYRAGGHAFVEFEGSYELTPQWVEAVDRLQLFPKKFLVSIFLVGGLFWLLGWLLGDVAAWAGLDFAASIYGFLLGMLVFTRLAVVGMHLQNVWLFRHFASGRSGATGKIRYGRATSYGISAIRWAAMALVVLAAALVARSAWIWGGFGGLVLLAVVMLVRYRRLRAR